MGSETGTVLTMILHLFYTMKQVTVKYVTYQN